MVSASLPPGEIATGHYMALAMTICRRRQKSVEVVEHMC